MCVPPFAALIHLCSSALPVLLPCRYEVELQNRGKIDVHYNLLPPSTAFGSKFTFEPSAGHLLGGQIQVLIGRRHRPGH